MKNILSIPVLIFFILTLIITFTVDPALVFAKSLSPGSMFGKAHTNQPPKKGNTIRTPKEEAPDETTFTEETEYEYEEAEIDENGRPKLDKDGKPIPKKDKDGNIITYKRTLIVRWTRLSDGQYLWEYFWKDDMWRTKHTYKYDINNQLIHRSGYGVPYFDKQEEEEEKRRKAEEEKQAAVFQQLDGLANTTYASAVGPGVLGPGGSANIQYTVAPPMIQGMHPTGEMMSDDSES